MSILNVVGAKVWGGGEQYVYDMCDELHRRQISSFVLVDETNQELQDRFTSVSEIITANLYSCKGFLSIGSIVKQMNQYGIDVILRNTPRISYNKLLRFFICTVNNRKAMGINAIIN